MAVATLERELRIGYQLHPRQWEAMRLLGLDPDHAPRQPVEELLFGGQSGGG